METRRASHVEGLLATYCAGIMEKCCGLTLQNVILLKLSVTFRSSTLLWSTLQVHSGYQYIYVHHHITHIYLILSHTHTWHTAFPYQAHTLRCSVGGTVGARSNFGGFSTWMLQQNKSSVFFLAGWRP